MIRSGAFLTVLLFLSLASVSCRHTSSDRQPHAVGSNSGDTPLAFNEILEAAQQAANTSNHLENLQALQIGMAIDQEDFGALLSARTRTFHVTPDRHSALALIACHMRNLSVNEAFDVYRKILAETPNDPVLLESFARDLGRVGRYDEGVEIYRRLAQVDPARRREHLLSSANLNRVAERPGKAEADIVAALAREPAESCHFRTGARLHRLMENQRKALDVYRTAIRLDRADSDLLLEAVNQAWTMGFNTEARMYALTLRRSQMKFRDHLDGAQHMSRSYRWLVESPERIDPLTETLKANPRDEDTRLDLALTLASNGDGLEAMKTIDAGFALAPDSSSLHQAKLHILEISGRFAEGIELCRQLLDRNPPDRAEILRTLGRLCVAVGRLSEAESAWERLPDIAQQATLFTEHGMPLIAIRKYRQSIRTRPLDTDLYHALARLLIVNGQSSEAIDVLRGLLVLDPDDLRALRDLGRLYVHTGQRKQMLATGRRILHTLPPNKAPTPYEDYTQYESCERRGKDKLVAVDPLVDALAFFQAFDALPDYLALLDSDLKAHPNDPGRALSILAVFERAGDYSRTTALIRQLLNGPPIPARLLPEDPEHRGRSLRSRLISRLTAQYGRPEFRETAMAEFKALRAKYRQLPQDYDSLAYATLLDDANQPEPALAVLDSSLAGTTEPAPLQWARAVLLLKLKRYPEAVTALEQVVATPFPKPAEERDETGKRVEQILYAMIEQHRALITEADQELMRRLLDPENSSDAKTPSSLTDTPTRTGSLLLLVDTCYRADQRDKARQILAQLDAGRAACLYGLPRICHNNGDDDLAFQLLEMQQTKLSRSSDILSLLRRYTREDVADIDTGLLSDCYSKQQKYADAYDVKRSCVRAQDYGRDDLAPELYSFIKEHQIADALVVRYKEQLQQATRDCKSFHRSSGERNDPEHRFRFEQVRSRALEAGYKLAEVHQAANHFKSAAEIYRQLLTLDPDDGAVIGCLRILAMKEQDLDTAVRHQGQLLDLYIAKLNDPDRNQERIYPELAPFNPKSDRDDWDDAKTWGHHSYSTLYRSRDDGRLHGAIDDEMQRLATTHLKAGNKDKAVAALQSYAQKAHIEPRAEARALSVFADYSDSWQQVLPIVADVVHSNPHDHHLTIGYAQDLIAHGDYKPAADLCLSLQSKTAPYPTDKELVDDIDKCLQEISKQAPHLLPTLAAPSPDEIHKAARDNPSNPAAQFQLLRLLCSQDKLDEALVVSGKIRALTRVYPEHETLRSALLKILGRDAIWLREKEETLSRLKPQDQAKILQELADYHYEHGDFKKAAERCEQQAIPDDIESHVSAVYSLARLGRYDRMLVLLKRMESFPPTYSFDRQANQLAQLWTLLRQNNTDGAVALYKDLTRSAEPYSIHDALWKVFRMHGRLDLIAHAVDQRVSDTPDSLDTIRRKCAFMEFLGNRTGSIPLYRQILQKAPEDPIARDAFRRFESERATPAEIEAEARTALARDPSSAEHRAALADCLIRQGRRDEARQCLLGIHTNNDPGTALKAAEELSARNFDQDALKKLQVYLDSTPSLTLDLYNSWVSMLISAGEINTAYDVAAKRHRLYLSKNEDRGYGNVDSNPPPVRDFELYRLARATGQMEKYFSLLKNIAAEDPTCVALQTELAGAYALDGQWAEYGQWMEHLVKTFARNIQLQEQLLAFHELNEDWPACIRILEDRIVRVPGQRQSANLRLARCFEHLGELDKAEKGFENAAIEENSARFYAWLAQWELGRDRTEKARLAIERAMELDDDKRLCLDHGMILARLGQTRAAIREYHEAANPDHWSWSIARRHMLRLYEQDTFVQDMEKQLREKSNDPKALHDMILIREAQGQPDEAHSLRLRLFELDKNNLSLIKKICEHFESTRQHTELLPYYNRLIRAKKLGILNHWEYFNLQDLELRTTTIRHEIGGTPLPDTPPWGHPFQTYMRYHSFDDDIVKGQRLLLNQGSPDKAIELSKLAAIPNFREIRDSDSGRPVDYRLAIAYLEKGQLLNAKQLLARHVPFPDSRDLACRPWSPQTRADHDFTFRSLDLDGEAFYEATRIFNCTKDIVDSLEAAFKAHKDQDINDRLAGLLAFHYRQNKQYDRLERLIITHVPAELAQLDALASIARERGAWSVAIGRLQDIARINPRQRFSALQKIATIQEYQSIELEKALATYRELAKLQTSWNTPLTNLDKHQYFGDCRAPKTNDDGFEDDAPEFFSVGSQPSDLDSEAYKNLSEPNASALGVVDDVAGDRLNILRVLLKLKRIDAASALEQEILAIQPPVVKGHLPSESIRQYLLEKIADCHATAGDAVGAMERRKEAHKLAVELINRSTRLPRRRERLLREHSLKHFETMMDLAVTAGQSDEYANALTEWKTRLLKDREIERIGNAWMDPTTLDIVSRLVNAPPAVQRADYLAEARRLLQELDDPDVTRANLFRADIGFRSGQLEQARTTCESAVAKLDQQDADRQKRDRYFGRTDCILKYTPKKDPLESLDSDQLLLIAQIAHATQNAALKQRALTLATAKDKTRTYWRWTHPNNLTP